MLLDVVDDGVEAGRTTLNRHRGRAPLSVLHLIDVCVQRGLPQYFKTHLTELVQPAFRQRRAPLQRQVQRVQQRIVDVEYGPLSNLVYSIVDLVDDLWLLVCRHELVLNLSQERDDLLRRRFQQVCVVHGSLF